MSKTTANIGSRKHAVFAAHSFSPGLLQQRAGLKGHFANSNVVIAIPPPPADHLEPLYSQ